MTSTLFRRLEVFCAIVETGSATAAAERLRLSQPAVSQQLSRLEEELGLTLFVRSNGRMRPTETALTIFDEARHAFDGIDRVLNLAQDIRGLDRGLLRIAAPHSLAATCLPQALKKLAAGRPRLRISVALGTYEKIVSLVAAREADLAIAKAPVMSPGLDSIEIGATPLVAVLAADSPFAAAPELDLPALARTPLVMIGRGRPWRDEIDVAFRKAGIAPMVAVETQSVESACGFAAEGFGVAIVPDWLAQALSRTDVVRRPLAMGIEHRFLVVYPSRSRMGDLAAAFAGHCRDAGSFAAGQVAPPDHADRAAEAPG